MDTILLFDDDCGICTSFSGFLHRLLGVPILAMHDPKTEQEGIAKIGYEEYWKSFHIKKNGVIYTEAEAIVELAELFPFGRIMRRIAGFRPILFVLVHILGAMQQRRGNTCINRT